MAGRVMRVWEAAEFIGLAPATLYRKAARREIPTIKVGRALLFGEEDLRALLVSGLRPASLREEDLPSATCRHCHRRSTGTACQ
jgi:excisionase family DNA binding protein